MKETREKYCCNGGDKDDIVISGVSGRFHKSNNVQEFKDYIYSKKPQDVIRRSKKEYFDPFFCTSFLKDLSKFDAKYFNVSKSIVQKIEPQLRMLYEVVYEAIVDSGYTMEELSRMIVGTYGVSSENPAFDLASQKQKVPFCTRVMTENHYSCCVTQISHFFNFKGPCFLSESACASFLAALKDARDDIRRGVCDMAVVVGIHVELNPCKSLLQKNKVQASKGFLRPFDAKACGYTAGEAIGAILVQRAGTARRLYASIVDIQKLTMGYNPQSVYAVSLDSQLQLLQRFYDTVNVNPLDFKYAELHGTGTTLGDPIETKAVATVFCNGRKDPLPIGTSKSNFGHCEEASGMVSMLKVILGFELGKIAPNVNFDTPNPVCTPIVDGTLKVVLDPLDIDNDYISINNYGIGGVIVHGCFKRNPICIKGDDKISQHGIPKLIVFSSPSKEGVQSLIDCVKTHSASKELTSLLYKVAHENKGHLYRGYYLNWKNYAVQNIQRKRVKKRPLFYIFSSMGCQWPGMGLDLLKFEAFYDSMMKSAEILRGLGIDLLELLKPNFISDSQSRHIIPAFVSITAIQIALVDLLKSLDLEPDGIIGHSTGEMACAYADGCCTAEQVLLLSYWRGKSVENADLINGKMATIALSMEEARKFCPKDVYIVCHNAPNLVTISGPTAVVNTFLQQLKGKGILSVIVRCFNYAFHSVHVAPAATELQRELSKVLCNPKKISHRWISTSYPKEELHLPEAKTADASYFVHNLLSPVCFYETLLEIPKDAVLLEIGPHHTFESILKQVLGPDADFFGLMREKSDNATFLLENVGKLYNAGLDPMIENLYPPSNYPVPRNTPMISSYIKWDHAKKYDVPSPMHSLVKIETEKSVSSFLKDHAVANRVLFPGTGYLVAVWQVFAEANGKSVSELPVIFEHVRIFSATVLPENEKVQMKINISEVNGRFEIRGYEDIIVSGFIRKSNVVSDPTDFPNYQSGGDMTRVLTTTDIHDMLNIFGYQHGPEFQNILEFDIEESRGLLKWRNNWVIFLDSMLILMFVDMNLSTLMLPVGLEFVKVDPIFQHEVLERNPDFIEKGVPAYFDALSSSCVSVGAEIRGILAVPSLQGLHEQSIIHEEHVFVPFFEDCVLSDAEKSRYKSYRDCCIIEAEAISQLLKNGLVKNDKNTEAPDFTMVPPGNQILLNTLKTMYDHLKSKGHIANPEQMYSNYFRKLQNDYLSRTLLTNETLKNVFDVVEENVFDLIIQAVEISSSCFPLSFQISKLVQKTQFKNWEFTVAHDAPSIIHPELFKKQTVIVEKTNEWRLLESKNKHVLICSFLGGSKQSLHKFITTISCIHVDGFFVVLYRSETSLAEKVLQEICQSPLEVHPLEVFEDILDEEHILSVARKSDSFGMHLYLLKTSDYQDAILVRELKADFEEWVPKTIEAVKKLEEDKNASLWIVSIGDVKNGILGFVKCLQREPNGERIKCIYVSDKSNNAILNFDKDDSFYADIIEKSLQFNVFKNGTWGTYRHRIVKMESAIKDCKHVKAGIKKITDLSSLRWTNSLLPFQGESVNLIEVYCSALNFRDIVIATGRIIEDNSTAEHSIMLGIEFAGRNSNGERIFGISENCLSSTVKEREFLQWRIPDQWTMQQACAIPIVYMTCFSSLLLRTKLQNGERILIHSASGGLGQAAINIALSMDCEIFTTVGTKKKKEYLLKKFPQLKPENIGYSRDTSFKNTILRQTQGKGVDVIINFLIEDKLQAGLECLTTNGRFVEIGKYDLMNNNFLYLESFPENVSFISINLTEILHGNPERHNLSEQVELHKIMQENFEKGVVKPLDITVFEREQLEDSFRFLAAGKHLGKVVVKIRDEESELITKPEPAVSKVEMTTFFHSTKCYLIIGGLGGFGMALVEWMISRGARKVVLSSRSGSLTGYHKFKLAKFRSMGAHIEVVKLDASDANEAKELLLRAEKLGTIGGVFNLALVLNDALYVNQTSKSFAVVCAPKVAVTENMDRLTRDMCPDLDWFVCFSSVSSGKGNAGQTNYGFGNSAMERICEIRHKDGLHGLAIQWGVIGDVGVIHRSGLKFADNIIGPQPILSCLSSLDELLHRDQPVVCCFLKNDKGNARGSADDIWRRVIYLTGFEDTVDSKETLGKLGIDSLSLAEIRRFLEKACQVNIKQNELQDLTKAEVVNLSQSQAENSSSSLSPIVGLPWISKTRKVELNKQTKGIPLFIVVSVSRVYELKAFANSLKVPIYGILINSSVSSPQEENEAFIKDIQEIVRKGRFNLAGYSDGAIIATQLVIKIKRSPEKYPSLNYFFIISGYLAIRDVIQGKQSSSISSDTDGIVDIVTKWTGLEISTMKGELQKLNSIEEKIDLTCDFLADLYSINAMERQTVKDALHQEHASRALLTTTAIRGKVMQDVQFFEAAEETADTSCQEMETQLSKIYKGKIDLEILSTYGSSLLEPPWCSDIANILEDNLKAESE